MAKIAAEGTVKNTKKSTSKKTAVVNQKRKTTLGQCIAALAAGFLPIASFVVAHHEMKSNFYLIFIVIAGLVFSAPTLVTWAEKWCGNRWKAIGFSVLLESTMVVVNNEWLCYSALVILCIINCYSAYNNFGQASKPKRKPVAKTAVKKVSTSTELVAQ